MFFLPAGLPKVVMKKYCGFVWRALGALWQVSPVRCVLVFLSFGLSAVLATLASLLPGQAVLLTGTGNLTRNLLLVGALFCAIWLLAAAIKALILPVYGFLEQKAQSRVAADALGLSYTSQKGRNSRDNSEISFAIDTQMAVLRDTASTVLFSLLPALCVLVTGVVSLAIIGGVFPALIYLCGMCLFVLLSKPLIEKHQQAQGEFFGENMKNFGVLSNYVNYWKETHSFGLVAGNTRAYRESRSSVEASGVRSYGATRNLYLFQAALLCAVMASMLGCYLWATPADPQSAALAGFISLTGVSLYSIQVIQDIGFAISALVAAYAQDRESLGKIQSLSAEAGSQRVPRHLDSPLPERGLVWILGDSGAGKTTYLETLLGFTSVLPPEHLAEKRFSEVRYLPQETNLTFQTAFECARAGRDISSADVDSCFRRLKLEAFSSGGSRYGEVIAGEDSGVSGGEGRRICLARTLLGPSGALVVLDEPTTGVGKDHQSLAWELVRELSETSLVLVVTHDPAAPIEPVDTVLNF